MIKILGYICFAVPAIGLYLVMVKFFGIRLTIIILVISAIVTAWLVVGAILVTL